MPWDSGGGSGTGGGTASGPVILDPLVSMRRSLIQANDTEVLTYETQAENPSYLRVSVLETFDGETWRAREGLETGREAGVTLPANVLSAFVAVNDSNRVRGGDSYTYDITVDQPAEHLPAPAVPRVADRRHRRAGHRLEPRPEHRGRILDGHRGHGPLLPGRGPRPAHPVRAAARRGGSQGRLLASAEPARRHDAADRGAGPGDHRDRRDARTTRPSPCSAGSPGTAASPTAQTCRSGTDADYIAEFLEQRVGYCEQFAGAMAIMARSLGIPSRVVVGFTQGAQDEDGVWRVTVRDAHAWPELWFEGVGWARFEPTPRSGATVFTPEYARAADGDIPQGGDRRTTAPSLELDRGLRSRRDRPLDRAVPPPRPDRPARAAGDGAAARRADGPPAGASPSSPARASVRRRRRRRVGRGGRPGHRLRPAVVGVQHAAAGGGAAVARHGRAIGRGAATAAPGGGAGALRTRTGSGHGSMRARGGGAGRTCERCSGSCATGCGGRPGWRPTAGRPPSDGASGPPCDP